MGGAWDILARRVDAISEYRTRFAVLGTVGIHITDIGTALSAYIGTEFRVTDSPFVHNLQGEDTMTEAQLEGMDLFYWQGTVFHTPQRAVPDRSRLLRPRPAAVWTGQVKLRRSRSQFGHGGGRRHVSLSQAKPAKYYAIRPLGP